ncbi:MAG: hypothetical protein LBV02_03410 [Bacteroidales bacterium]|jgi:hypothetical protein|nr:hypothetical protein [Bacteroidales bacterium]
MKKNILIIATTLGVAISCMGKKNDSQPDGNIAVSNDDPAADCFNSVFYNHMHEYIRKTFSIDGPPVYYSVYFFTQDSIDYFTTWTDYSSPKGWMKYANPSSNFKYSTLAVNGKDVVIITKDTYNNEELYRCCESLIEKDSIPEYEDTGIINDGRLYIETVSYSLQEGKYVLDKLEVPIVDIFGDLHEMFW